MGDLIAEVAEGMALVAAGAGRQAYQVEALRDSAWIEYEQARYVESESNSWGGWT
jgi:hypothetical protein